MTSTPDASELLAKAVKGAQALELKRILEKLNSREALTQAEMKTLAEHQRRLEDEKVKADPATREFKNALEVAAYLKEAGWKVKKSTVYAHIKQGKLKPEEGGRFPLKAVEKYAASFLMMSDTLQKLGDEGLSRKKLKAEIERIQEQVKRERLRRLVDEGRYIPRESFELELAARAVVWDTLRRNSVMALAAERVALVAGDPKRIPDLIAFDMAQHADEMNQFATTREFHVLFEKTEETRQDKQD